MLKHTLLVSIGLVTASTVRAQEQFGLEGAGSSFSGSYSNHNGKLGGIRFHTGGGATQLESVSWWGLAFLDGLDFTVSLYEGGTSDTYGSLIGTVGTATSGASFAGAYMSVTPGTDFVLSADTDYWVGFDALEGMALMGINTIDGEFATLDDYTSEVGWVANGAYNIGVSVNNESTVYAMNITVTAIPESSTFLISTVGGMMFFLRRSRRR